MPDLLPLALPRAIDGDDVWAITPAAHAALIAGNMFAGSARSAPTMELAAGRSGKSVARIRLSGVLTRDLTWMTGTSTGQVRRDVFQAAADPNVSGILLEINSPGGQVDGIHDLAGQIELARRQKPVVAFVDGLAASAAYWVASAADFVYAGGPMAMVGSIGTFLPVPDLSKAAEAFGLKMHVFKTGELKGAGFPGTPVTDAQAADFQSRVNRAQGFFDAAVLARGRTTREQLEALKSGATLYADDAKAAGLIDGVRSHQKVFDALKAAR